MFDLLFEYYKVYPDTRPGAGITLNPNKALGTTVGDEVQRGDIYDKFILDEDEYDDIEIDEDTIDAVGVKLNQPVYSIDRKRSDPSHTSGNRRQSPGLNELHTNPIRKNSIAPYKQRKFDGPPIGSGNSNNIYRTGPGKKSGTVFGWSRGVIQLDDHPLYFGEEPRDKMEISFLRQQKNVNRVKNLIKEIEKDKNNDKTNNG